PARRGDPRRLDPGPRGRGHGRRRGRDGPHPRGRARPPPPPPLFRRPPGPGRGRARGGAGRVPAGLGRRAHVPRDRRIPPAGGEPEEIPMSEIGSALAKELGADRGAEDGATLAAPRVDYWILAPLRRKQGRLGPPPACVVKPRSTAEVAKTIQLAQRHGT